MTSGIYDAENLMWQEKARNVAEKVVRPLARKYDELQQYPWEIKDALANEGLLSVWIPKEYGGAGGGVANLCIVVEELSRACPGVGVLFAVNALGSFPIIISGTEEQKRKYLPKIAAGETLMSFCLSEKEAGSDAGALRVRGIPQPDGTFKIYGEKKWTTNGSAANLFTVFAVTDPEKGSRGMTAFLVEKTDPGFSIAKVEDKMGIRCVPVVETRFDGVTVGPDRLLGGKAGLGFKHAMQTLDRARPGVAAQGVGCAQGAMEYALRYTTQRIQFGEPVSSKQMVQGMLADMAMQVEAARQLVLAAARSLDAGDPKGSKLAAMAKCFATDVAMKVSVDAVQLFGGYGFMKDYPIEKYMRDAKITQIYEGTNQVQRMVIARNMINESSNFAFLDAYIPKESQWKYEG